MATLRGLGIAALVALAAAGILMAGAFVPRSETASLLLLGIGLVGSATLLRSQIPNLVNEDDGLQEQALPSRDQGELFDMH